MASCGFPSTVPNYDQLPASADRGDHSKALGTMSSGWELIEKFDSVLMCMNAGVPTNASLWYRSNEGFETFYLYQFDPTPADPIWKSASVILAFKKDGEQLKACAWGRTGYGEAEDMHDLYYAGRFIDPIWMHDCSDCHIHGPLTPGLKMYDLARKPRFDWLDTTWKPAAARFDFPDLGVEWIVGPSGANAPLYEIEGTWQGGTTRNENRAGVVSPNCRLCHGNQWVEPRNAAKFCQEGFAPAFEPPPQEGSMAKLGKKFLTKQNCRDLFDELGGCSNQKVDTLCGAASTSSPKGPAVAIGPAPEWENKNIVIAKSGPTGSATEWDTVTICFDPVSVPNPGRVMKYATIAARNLPGSTLVGVEPDRADMLVDDPPQGPGRRYSRINTRTVTDPAAHTRNFNLHTLLEDDPQKVWFVLGALVDKTGAWPNGHSPDELPVSQWLNAAQAVYNGCGTPPPPNPGDASVSDATDASDASADGGDASDAGDADVYYVYYPDATGSDVYDAGDAGYDSGIYVPPSDSGARDATSRDATSIFGPW